MSKLSRSSSAATKRVAVSLLVTLVAACGGGGGGGGGGGPGPGTGSSDSVTFEGFTFRIGSGIPTSAPPIEDLTAAPPTLGAPLDVAVIFNFSGVPQGPFNQANLPVYTTPSEVSPDAQASPAMPIIQAKGAYVAVGNTVEFRPFVPTETLQLTLSAPAASVPGLLPSSTYTAKVLTTTGQKLPNLKGPGGAVKFDTTSLEAGYFTGAGNDGLPPLILSATPEDGTPDFYPAPYSNFALGVAEPSFPPGDETVTITYDHQLSPTADNLGGQDWDGDGYVEPNFFLRAQATRLLVAQTVPAGSSIGNADAFPALAGLTAGQAVPADGDAIFLHDSQGAGALPGADPALALTPASIATARDPALLYVILRVDGGPDIFSVADHVLGDPSFADLAAAGLDTGLDTVVGLVTLQSGRVVGYDTATRQLYELIPQVTRLRPVGEPVLAGLTVGDGTTGFRSDIFPAGQDVLDLTQSPSGDLYALLQVSGSPFPHLQRLTPIDPDLNGVFAAGEGLPDDSPPLLLDDAYGAMSFVDPQTLLGLNRGTDGIDEIDLATGFTGTVVSAAAAYGVPLAGLPGGLSPALDLEVGYMESDVNVALLANDTSHAVVRLSPRGVLPIGSRLDVMQRHVLATVQGISEANADPDNPLSVLGASRVLSVTTSSPISTLGPCAPDPDDRVNDVVNETFDDTSLEDPQPADVSPPAEWAELVSGGGTTGHLRASVGVGSADFLGDFLPKANADFDPAMAYKHPTVQKPHPELEANFKMVFLDTDAQNFPLPNGETPGVTANITVFGGHFTFRDFIIPEGVWVIAKGTHPLQITATGKVEIRGVLDVSGSPGVSDTTFDTGFLPTPGGSGGPGAGRGGDGHPTVFPPNAPQAHCANTAFYAAYATPEAGENGFAPVALPAGGISFQNGTTKTGSTSIAGGRGGISTVGYDPDEFGFPSVANNGGSSEVHRPPGGGGGSFYFRGMASPRGTGSYRVQSSSSFGNFTLCPTNNKISDALYGTEELQFCCGSKPMPLQCVYMLGTPADPERFQPPSLPGDLVFKDGNPDNDFFGGDGELQVLIGGQGGGGGGTRVDSMKHSLWAFDSVGSPFPGTPPPPCYPNLNIGFWVAPTLYDAKGGGGGGGGGSLLIRSFGDIVISRDGHIDASGGDGGGGETVGSSNYSGGGGGGSGGAVILQAAGEIRCEADANHKSQWFVDDSGAMGAAIDVSGGRGMDATMLAGALTDFNKPNYEFSRSDGGQGGFGLIQLQEGGGDGMPTIQQGASLFARQVGTIKRYKALTPSLISLQFEHPQFVGANKPPDELRYIDVLYYRSFFYGSAALADSWYVLHGSDPPIVEVTDAGVLGPYSLDTPMIDYFGKRVVKEPEAQKLLATYNGWDATFKEIGVEGQLPGTPHLATDVFPFSTRLKEPDGTALTKVIDGVEQFDPEILVDRLPVVHPSKAPPEFGTVSRGTSKWLDFNGVALRVRDANGIAPPLFSDGINGTFNALHGPPPPGKDGQIMTGNPVPGVPGKFVLNTGLPPVDPGLCGGGEGPKFNDIKCDAPEFAKQNVVTDNASVKLFFQGSFPIRAGSHVPDPATLTAWVSDLRELSGFPLVRFQVVFDVSVDQDLFPFSEDSLRPSVDEVRLRTRY
jgi:hypothetical protein